MANTTDLCPQCGVALANHVCPQRVGTVPGIVTTYSHNGATVTKVVRAVSKNNACVRCGLVHHNERGTKIVCTVTAAARYHGYKVNPDSPDFFRAVADFLDYEAGNNAAPVQAAPVQAAPKADAPKAETKAEKSKRIKAELAKAR